MNLIEKINLVNDPSFKTSIRKYEKLKKKEINLQYSTKFNETCINDQLFPNYVNLRLHDPAANNEQFTKDYKIKLIQRQIENNSNSIKELENESSQILSDLLVDNNNINLKEQIIQEVNLILSQHELATKSRIINKLNKLYKGTINLPEGRDYFLNLSSKSLTDDQKKLLNMGTNCHISSKFDPLQKSLELEQLYCSVMKLQEQGVATVNPAIRDQLRSENTKCRKFNNNTKPIMTNALKNAAKELRNDPNIVVRKADKANIYVILDKNEYKQKLDSILRDESKFTKIKKNPTSSIKVKANKLIARANFRKKEKVLKPIIGEFKPGYLYGNVKTHKNGNPLRPIISQIPTATYDLAKQLNNIITPYLPNKFMLNSTDEFLNILQTTNPDGMIASLDVESLFTNVPIKETIEIICNACYNHETLLAPSFSKKIMKELLELCTMEAPFKHIDGSLYKQIDGVAMGSPLGVIFANFYMCNLENKVIEDNKDLIKTYARYVDDCYLVIENSEKLEKFKEEMEKNSVLKFTFEKSVNQELNFLDVHVNGSSGTYVTSVFTKPTNIGAYLNAKSECPQKYKTATIRALIHRAYKISSTWKLFDSQIKKLKQALINNGYSNTLFDETLKNYLNKILNFNNSCTPKISHKLYYKNQYSNAYKVDERVLKNIINNNVKCNRPNEKVNLIIYYKSRKTTSLIMKNDLTSSNDNEMQNTNLVYQYKCSIGECELQKKQNYIGMTCTTLSRRLTMHLVAGAPKLHTEVTHKCKLTRDMLVNGTKIIYKDNNFHKIAIMESLLIKKYEPEINRQDTGRSRTLLLLGS